MFFCTFMFKYFILRLFKSEMMIRNKIVYDSVLSFQLYSPHCRRTFLWNNLKLSVILINLMEYYVFFIRINWMNQLNVKLKLFYNIHDYCWTHQHDHNFELLDRIFSWFLLLDRIFNWFLLEFIRFNLRQFLNLKSDINNLQIKIANIF